MTNAWIADNSSSITVHKAVLVLGLPSSTQEKRWVDFAQQLRRVVPESETTVEHVAQLTDNSSATSRLGPRSHVGTVKKGAAHVRPPAVLARISENFESKHRSETTRRAFQQMRAAVEDAVKGLAQILGGNLAGVVLSGPLVEAQVGDSSVDLLVVLHELPDSVYELSKRLSAQVLYPIFKAHRVFPGLWCISIEEWKKAQTSPSARMWPKKEQGIVIVGEETLGQS